MNSLVWFRRDLRVHDNMALHNAAASTGSDGRVVGLFVITPKQWKQHDDADLKVAFWLENLRCLADALEKINIPLRIETCDSFTQVPDVVEKVCKSLDCGDVFFNREYEVNEAARDEAVVERCQSLTIGVNRFHDRVVVPPREIKTKEEKFYSVFTPYRKVWDRKVDDYSKVIAKPKKQSTVNIDSSPVPSSIEGFDLAAGRPDLYPAGEAEAARRLKEFAEQIDGYNENRDLPAVVGTSGLSAYLAAGVVSPRQCLAMAKKAVRASEGENEGAKVWVSELTWRDFYTHVLVGFPRVSKHLPFKEKTNGIDWRASQGDLAAWKEGRTGYPIVDAGMRQLNQTGWMHNRLRMVTAMFLTKNLLIDWRLGERYFMQKLIDGDLAANNGGWQWSASTGTDSVPYFRIFNPFSQSKRFDVDGEFIKKMCPELEPIPAKNLHDLKKLAAAIEKYDVDYPRFVVDYSEGRQRALAAFKSL